MIVTSMLFVMFFVCFFAGLSLCAWQSNTNGSILYDHAKYVILLAVADLENFGGGGF